MALPSSARTRACGVKVVKREEGLGEANGDAAKGELHEESEAQRDVGGLAARVALRRCPHAQPTEGAIRLGLEPIALGLDAGWAGGLVRAGVGDLQVDAVTIVPTDVGEEDGRWRVEVWSLEAEVGVLDACAAAHDEGACECVVRACAQARE